MADNNPFSNDDRSFLNAALAAAPTVGGVGVGIRRMVGEGIPTQRESSVAKAMGVLGSVQAEKPWEVSIDKHLAFIRGEQKYIGGPGAQVAQEAWARAIEGADPMARKQLLTFTSNIQALPPDQIFSAIENTMSRQRSELAETVYRRFKRNLTALRAQEAIIGGFVPYEKAAGSFEQQFKPLQGFMRESVGRIEASLGLEPGATRATWHTRPGWQEEGLGAFKLVFPTTKGDVSMVVPIAQEGMLASGVTQQTRYIAPDVWVWSKEAKKMEKFKRHEFLMHEFERTILPEIKAGRMDRRQIEKAVGSMQQRVVHELESVTNVPQDIRTKAQASYESMRRTAVDVMISEDDKIRRATENELIEIAKREGLFGGTSPTAMGKGRLQTVDPARLYMTPEAAETAKRLEQGIRKYELTADARAAMEAEGMERYTRYRKYESAAMREFEKDIRRPNVRTLYVDPKEIQALGIGEGEVLARRGLGDILEFQANQSQRLVEMRKDVKAALLEGKEIDVKPGEIIGWTETQQPFRMEKNMKLMRAIEHRNRSLGEFFTLHYMDTQHLQSHDKVFEDMKALMRQQGDGKFNRAARRLAGSNEMASNIDVIASVDFLKKDPRKLEQQIISGMGEVLERRPMVPPGILRTFREAEGGVERVVKNWIQAAKTGPDMYSHKEFIKQAMGFAVREADVRPTEFREIFGAVPHAIGVSDTTKMIREVSKDLSEQVVAGYIKAVERAPLAAGIAKIAYAEPAATTGAGTMGSIETRILDILRGPTWGTLGEEVSEDIMRRLEYTNPEKFAVHKQLTKTLQSIAGDIKPPVGASIWKATKGYTSEDFDQFIERGGGWIRPGKGMRDIYTPGAPTLKAMREFQIGERTMRGQLADVYHNIAREASGMHQEVGRKTADMYKQELEKQAQELARHWAPGGKGMGAVTRGKFIGSRFLRGVSDIGGWTTRRKTANLDVAGVTTRMFEEMFEEMTTSNIYNKKQLSDFEHMRQRFMAGEEIGSGLLRHPTFGEFSFQPGRIQRIEASGTPEADWIRRAEIALPEIQVEAGIKGIADKKSLTLGPLVGLSGDKDADIYSALLLEPDVEKKVRQATTSTDSNFVHRYMQHQVRYQLLQPEKALEEEMSITGRRMADIRKLGTTQRWVPLLSTELSSARRAVVAAGGKEAANAWTLMEWLEQHLIKAKHISAKQMEKGGLEAMLEQTVSALRTRGEEGELRLKTVVQNIIKDDSVAGQLLTGNVTLDEASTEEISRIMGKKINPEIQGIDVDTTIRRMMSSMDRYESSGGSRWADLMMGRGGRVKLGEIGRMASESAASITRGTKGVFADVARAASAASNMAGAMGQSVIKNYKPLALGFAGSLAIGAALSSPPETIGPGAQFRNMKTNMNIGKASDRMKPETVMPDRQSLGEPTAPNMLSAPRTMIAPPTPARQTVVRARANYMVNTPDIAGRLAGVARGSRTNINLRDNRSNLNPHVIANRLI